MKQYNLIVAGGGFAGVAAAIAGAREGLSVLLLEETNALGGAASRCLVNPFMPYWTPIYPKEGESKRELSAGIFSEICQRLVDMTRSVHGETKYTKIPVGPFSEEYLKILLNRMVTESGACILYHTSVVAVKQENGTLISLTIANADGLSEISADYYIDCTGDADLAHLAGFPCQLGREEDHLCQPMTLCFRVGDVDRKKFDSQAAQLMQKLYKERQQAGLIKNIRENVLLFHTLADSVIHFNTTRVVKLNPTSAADVTKAEIEAREQVWEMFLFLRECVPGFENAQLLSTAMHIGVRESRMIEGHYTLTQEDLLACKKFEDGIAACNYDIDIHNPEGSGTSHYYFPPHEYYTIPYRCLVPKQAKNLLVAGRCISSTHEAQASYRIMPVVCTLGEAAGVAAAVAYREDQSVEKANVSAIRDILRKNGAVID